MRYLALLSLIVFCFACNRPDDKINPSGIYQGRIINSVCGNITVQFTDGAPLGQKSWTNPADSVCLNNVFRVANPCNWGGANGDVNIHFRIVPLSPQTCMQCQAWAPTPDTAYSIVVLH